MLCLSLRPAMLALLSVIWLPLQSRSADLADPFELPPPIGAEPAGDSGSVTDSVLVVGTASSHDLHRAVDSVPVADTVSTPETALIADRVTVSTTDSVGPVTTAAQVCTVYTASSPEAFHDRFSIGLEESGFLLRYRPFSFVKNADYPWLVTCGGGYRYLAQKDLLHRDLHEFHGKAGVVREFASSLRSRTGVFAEGMVKFKQFETDPLLGRIQYSVFNVWAFKARMGLVLSAFPAKHFGITYRLGIEGIYATPAYVLNNSRTSLERFGSGAFAVGLCGYETSPFELLLNNIGIHVVF